MEARRKIEPLLYLTSAHKMIKSNRGNALQTNSVYMEETKYGIR
jgi:hypothetical protein